MTRVGETLWRRAAEGGMKDGVASLRADGGGAAGGGRGTPPPPPLRLGRLRGSGSGTQEVREM
jgi:hypothetical protein